MEHKAAITAVKKLYEQKPAWSEKYIADVFEKVGLAKIVREQSNDALTNALQSAMIELSKVMPQSSHAWSEEDELIINKILCFCNDFERSFENSPLSRKEIKEDVKKIDNWLKSLKNRIQPKQEWSQNDIDMIDWLIRCCEKEHEELCNDKYGHQDIVSDLKRDCRKKWDWLESLKNRVAPQKQWKPSEEQLETLDYYIDADISNKDKEVLLGLYNDLKQL